MAKVIITEQYLEDIADAIRAKNGSQDTYYPSEMADAIEAIDTSGVTINNQNKSVTPTESLQSITADSGYTGLGTVTVNAISSNYVGSGITRRSSTDLTASGATVTVPSGYYSAQASKAVASGTAGTPTATKVVDTDDVSALITPSVTNTTGYITGGTKTGTSFYVTARELVSGNTLTCDEARNWDVAEVETFVVPSGTAGTPTATKGTVSNHSVSVTPSVTNQTGYITGSTKTGTVVTVSASELVSGTLSVTSNGTKDVTNYASVNVNISSEAPSIESLSVTPSESEQTFNASTVDGYKPVTVGAISSTYVGSGITRRSSTDLTRDSYTINVPAGYYAENASKTVERTTHATPTVSIDEATGLITAKHTQTQGWVEGSGSGADTTVKTLQLSIQAAKTVTPTESSQTAVAANVYTTGAVTVNAISSTYVGSGITRRSSTDLTVSGATVTAPAGYYAEAASKSVSTMTLPTAATSSATSGYTSKATIGRSTAAQYINIPPGYNSTGAYYVISAVANGSATAPASISGTAASVSTGTNTLTLTKTVSVTPTVSAGYVSSGTAGNSSVSLTASVTTKAAATITPTTTNQTIAAGTYLTGAQTIAGDADLVGGNILSTANIFGVQGTVDFIDIYIRSAAPTSSVGNDGDIYIQE